MKKTFTFLLLLSISSLHAQITTRLAYSADGNYHDTDDIGATPMAMAIVKAFGKNSQLVHIEINNHIGCNDNNAKNAHSSRVNTAKTNFGSTSNVYDIKSSRTTAKTNLKALIEASSSSDQLTIVAAGPYQTIYDALKASSSSSHKYVTILSHSDWNDDHTSSGDPTSCKVVGKTKADVAADFPDVKFKKIRDQNTDFGNGFSSSTWSWLSTGSNWKTAQKSNMQSLYDALGDSNHNSNGIWDPSDAGMMWYAMTGEDNCSVNKVKDKFTAKWGAAASARVAETNEVLEETLTAVNSDILIYPVPSEDNITIRPSGIKGNKTVRIYDFNRNIILSTKMSETDLEITLDTQKLKEGKYFVEVLDKNGSGNIKTIIKQ